MDNGTTVAVTPSEYLIRKGGAYYRPNAAGYTNNVAEAGRYSLEDAIRHSHPNGPNGPRDGIDYMPAPPSRIKFATGQVIQADRDAAAGAVKAYRDQKNGNWQQRIRDGLCDDGEMVQAFARHRHLISLDEAGDFPSEAEWRAQSEDERYQFLKRLYAARHQSGRTGAGEDGETLRQQGQREGKAAVCQWLRDRGAMRPPAVLHHAAGILADQFEQSEIPGASQ